MPRLLDWLLERLPGVRVHTLPLKFHLDTVAGLGEFIEIEAIDEDGTMGVEKLRAQCEHYLGLLSVPSEDLVAESYSDLLLHRR